MLSSQLAVTRCGPANGCLSLPPRPLSSLHPTQVEFFFVDSVPLVTSYRNNDFAIYDGGVFEQVWQDQYCVLKAQLAASCAKWKVLVAHHPTRSNGNSHGNTAQMISWVEPLILQYGVQVSCADGGALLAGLPAGTFEPGAAAAVVAGTDGS